MQATRCPLCVFCKLQLNHMEIVYSRMKLRILQHVNKPPWLYMQQGKHPPINIQNFSHLHVYTYLHSWYCLDVKKRGQPELLTPLLSLLHQIA